jgi:hypothetical protein
MANEAITQVVMWVEEREKKDKLKEILLDSNVCDAFFIINILTVIAVFLSSYNHICKFYQRRRYISRSNQRGNPSSQLQ